MQENTFSRMLQTISDIFNLRKDSDEKSTVENIRKNVDFYGANAWTLVFAIFIASIGLNMNSAAVIIGAMLISPLMGPILGVGLALGINDEILLRRSFRNLSIAVIISILTSMVYFLLSPIHDAQSELLARTYPTFYDVLIAFFGGAAGIVSISRKERGPSVAGVAIATALMPPLCTAGFALSTGNLKFLAGAFYLFIINSVFIALSTLFFVRYMKFQVVQHQEQDKRTKIRSWIGVVVITIIGPSLYFAWTLLQESRFNLRADRFINSEIHSPSTFIVGKELSFTYKGSKIKVTLVGSPLTETQIQDITRRLPVYGLEGTHLEVHQLKPDERSAGSPLEAELARLRMSQESGNAERALEANLSSEVALLFPSTEGVTLIGNRWGVIWSKKPRLDEVQKLNSFLALRDKTSSESPLHLEKIELKNKSGK